MPRVGAEEELRTLVECQYSYPAETESDLRSVRVRYPDLRLYVDFYCFPNKEKKKLVYLAGTVPVQYEGSQYNIPVCIWLHETHPVSRPRCYVCPSVSMVINPSCPCVDASGNISLDALKNWTHGVSDLSLIVSEMRRAFQLTTPLYAWSPEQAPPPVAEQVSPGRLHLPTSSLSSSITSSSSSMSGPKVSQWEQRLEARVRRSYAEELLGIDFSAPPPSSNHNNPFLSSASSSDTGQVMGPVPEPLSKMMGILSLDRESSRDQQVDSLGRTIRSGAARTASGPGPGPHQDGGSHRHQSGPGPEADHMRVRGTRAGQSQSVPAGPGLTPPPPTAQMAARLPPDQAAIFLSLMRMEGRSFSPSDVVEAVQLNRDLPSALRFLSHSCPICQDQVTFSKIITMTHCSCFLCVACFTAFFSAAIKERSIEHLVCPQCGRPEVTEDATDYFNLLDTQIRHFLSPQLHELFQRKLRDRALQNMKNFCWCSHCSFGFLHEAERLRMDCPSCRKSTCSRCRSPWTLEHQGRSCEQFRVWQQQNQPDPNRTGLLSYNSIECPRCQFVFSLSRGGCLHFTCSQCQHQFCGGCSQTFSPGSACGFSDDCGTKGLHAHHPRDCLYHLRDWSISRLHLLLQFYRVSPSWLEPVGGGSADSGPTGTCLVPELRDDGGRQEEACGRHALPEHRGYCQLHYKERLVELINRCGADPAAVFSRAETTAELQRWNITVPARNPDESEELYGRRLLLTLVNQVPLRKFRHSALRPDDGR